MAGNTDWDLDKYFSPHEPKHHWALRKAFMENNKGRYEEDRLVCLAQTFANMEFMGCRYPKATMDLVEEMSYGIVQPYREQQKGRLQRTFVSGADAAGSKVNKTKRKEANKRKAHFLAKKYDIHACDHTTNSCVIQVKQNISNIQ